MERSAGWRRRRALERDAFARREIRQCLVGERVHLGFLDLDLRHVDGIACHARAARGLVAFFGHHAFEATQRVAGAADVRDHAGRHLVQLGHGLVHAHVVDGALEAFDLGACGLHGNVARLDQVLVGGLGLFELGAILGELRVDGLQPQCVLPGGGVVAGADVRGGLGAQVLLLGLELAYLAHEAFGEPGVGGESLVELADLLAQVFLLQLEQRLGVAAFDAGYEQAT